MESRNLNIDFIKSLAMLFVVGLHSFFAYDLDANDNLPLHVFRQMVFGLAIPLFFMVSGYLLLGRTNANFKYSLKKITNILRLTFTITIGYCMLKSIATLSFDINMWIETMFLSFIQQGNFWVFWFLGAMILVYLVYPYTSEIYKRDIQIGKPHFYILVSITTLICLFFYILNITNHRYIDCTERDIPQMFRLWNWLIYFCLGGLAKTVLRNKNTNKKIWIGASVSIALFIVLKTLSAQHPILNSVEYNYSSPFMMCYTFFVFLYVMSINIAKISKIVNVTVPLFLPCYIFHPFVIAHTEMIAMKLSYLGCISSFIYWIFVSVVTLLLSYALMKIPYMNKVFKI